MKKKTANITKKQAIAPTGFTMWLVCNLWQREMRKALLDLDLTHAQYILLSTACEMGKGNEVITQIKLATLTGTDKMMVSKVLRTLEGKKLLKRNDLKTDNRAKHIVVTPKGSELCVKAGAVVQQFEKNFFGPVAKNEKTLTKTFAKILKQFE